MGKPPPTSAATSPAPCPSPRPRSYGGCSANEPPPHPGTLFASRRVRRRWMDTGMGPGNVFGGDTHLKVTLGMSWGAPGHGSAPPGKRWDPGGTHHGQLGGTEPWPAWVQAGAAAGGSTKHSPCHGEQRCCQRDSPWYLGGGLSPGSPAPQISQVLGGGCTAPPVPTSPAAALASSCKGTRKQTKPKARC